ncbi:hypothetical protein RND81_06G234000 [Saponaria officinalis]|uniref:SHSP domain-containing protein n=1 Tax=Saponaria officinalis TaxID=3572 RepID=A0AAW1KA00_SAPOF
MVKADVVSGIKGYFINLEVAGINDLKIEFKKDAREVWVSDEYVGPNPDFGHYILFERTHGHFWRRFQFPLGSLMDHLEFRFHDDVLHISAPSGGRKNFCLGGHNFFFPLKLISS